MNICLLVLVRCLEWWFCVFPQFSCTLSTQFTFCFVSWQERIGMWVPPSVISSSYVRSMLGTCPHPLVKGVVAPGPLRKGFLIESLLALPGPPYSGRMTSFKVLEYRGPFLIWSRKEGRQLLTSQNFVILWKWFFFHLPSQMIRGDLSPPAAGTPHCLNLEYCPG